MATVVVSYKGFPDWPSPERLDERLEKLLKKECSGSGCGGGGRDVDWYFRSEEKAKEAVKAIRKYLKKEKEARYRKAVVELY